MTWPVRSKRLASYAATPAAGVWIALGTVPAGKTWLLKEFVIYAAGAASHTVFFRINAGATSYVVEKLVAGSTAMAASVDRDVVATASEVLEFTTSSATALQLTVHGAQLG